MSAPSITIRHDAGDAKFPWTVVIAGEDNAAFATEEEAAEHALAVELLAKLPDLNELEESARTALNDWDVDWVEQASPALVIGLLYKLKAAQTMLDIAREQGFA